MSVKIRKVLRHRKLNSVITTIWHKIKLSYEYSIIIVFLPEGSKSAEITSIST